FMTELGLEHLLTNPKFANNEQRMVNRAELTQLINERLASDSQQHWLQRLNAAGVPCGLVQDVGEALNDPQVLQQEMVIEVDHPGHGTVRMLGFPLKLSGTPCRVRLPAPSLGAHNDEVLGQLDMAHGGAPAVL
ncbi:MAG: CoA transferase, partial [Comamonadaceae bacterium]